jgi:hypothetical protein
MSFASVMVAKLVVPKIATCHTYHVEWVSVGKSYLVGNKGPAEGPKLYQHLRGTAKIRNWNVLCDEDLEAEICADVRLNRFRKFLESFGSGCGFFYGHLLQYDHACVPPISAFRNLSDCHTNGIPTLPSFHQVNGKAENHPPVSPSNAESTPHSTLSHPALLRDPGHSKTSDNRP